MRGGKMITIKKIDIKKNWSARNGREGSTIFYNVSVTEKYDLVQFIIDELGYDIYWCVGIGVPLDTSEEEINKYVEKYCKTLKKSDVMDYKKFIDDGDKYGWD